MIHCQLLMNPFIKNFMFLQVHYNTEGQVFIYPASYVLITQLFSQHHFKAIIYTGSLLYDRFTITLLPEQIFL